MLVRGPGRADAAEAAAAARVTGREAVSRRTAEGGMPIWRSMRFSAAMSSKSRLPGRRCSSAGVAALCGAVPGRAQARLAASGAAGRRSAVATGPTHAAAGLGGPPPQVLTEVRSRV